MCVNKAFAEQTQDRVGSKGEVRHPKARISAAHELIKENNAGAVHPGVAKKTETAKRANVGWQQV